MEVQQLAHNIIIVCKRVSTPPSTITRIPSISWNPPFPTLLTNRPSQDVLINRNATVKLSSINTIHVKQKHNVGLLIFKFTLKYILGNAYSNKINARQCFYIISLYFYIIGKVAPMLSDSLLYSKESFTSNFKTASEEKIFQWSNFQLISICYYVKKNPISIN